jgi:hypothetical protein
VLGAIDTNGEVYTALSQSNTDHETKILFLKHLFKVLDLERPGWRETTYLIMDGASYNTAVET